MAMWGKATDNEEMSRLGRLQLSVLARSISTYFLMTNDNAVHPAAFVRNKVGCGNGDMCATGACGSLCRGDQGVETENTDPKGSDWPLFEAANNYHHHYKLATDVNSSTAACEFSRSDPFDSPVTLPPGGLTRTQFIRHCEKECLAVVVHTSNEKVLLVLYVHGQVTGILFEMKVDYTTWFGANPEYIHGIQVGFCGK